MLLSVALTSSFLSVLHGYCDNQRLYFYDVSGSENLCFSSFASVWTVGQLIKCHNFTHLLSPSSSMLLANLTLLSSVCTKFLHAAARMPFGPAPFSNAASSCGYSLRWWLLISMPMPSSYSLVSTSGRRPLGTVSRIPVRLREWCLRCFWMPCHPIPSVARVVVGSCSCLSCGNLWVSHVDWRIDLLMMLCRLPVANSSSRLFLELWIPFLPVGSRRPFPQFIMSGHCRCSSLMLYQATVFAESVYVFLFWAERCSAYRQFGCQVVMLGRSAVDDICLQCFLRDVSLRYISHQCGTHWHLFCCGFRPLILPKYTEVSNVSAVYRWSAYICILADFGPRCLSIYFWTAGRRRAGIILKIQFISSWFSNGITFIWAVPICGTIPLGFYAVSRITSLHPSSAIRLSTRFLYLIVGYVFRDPVACMQILPSRSTSILSSDLDARSRIGSFI